jgi:hypothetical protein
MPGCCCATSPPVSQCCVACGTRLCRAGTWLYRTTTSAPSTRCPRSRASRSSRGSCSAAGCGRACRARLPELFAQAGIGTRDGTDVASRLERLADVRGPVYRRLQRGAFDRDAYGVSTERQAAAWDAAFAHDVERFPDRSRAVAAAHRTWKRQPAKARPHGGTWLTQAILAGVPCLSQRADGALWSRMMTATQAFSRPWTSRRRGATAKAQATDAAHLCLTTTPRGNDEMPTTPWSRTSGRATPAG